MSAFRYKGFIKFNCCLILEVVKFYKKLLVGYVSLLKSNDGVSRGLV